MQPVVLSQVSVSGDFRAWCERSSGLPLDPVFEESQTVCYDCTVDVSFHVVHSTDSTVSAAGELSVSRDKRYRNRNTANSSGSRHVDNSRGSVRDTHHNRNGLRDSGDRKSDNSTGDNSHSLSRNR